MKAFALHALLWTIALSPGIGLDAQDRTEMRAANEDNNREFIRQAFASWERGESDVFSHLAEDVTWRVTGHDASISKVYRGREDLLAATARPLAARLKTPLRPTVDRIWADGDDVLVLWEGSASVYDGSEYHNTYLWILTIRDRKIVAVTAFLDVAAFKAVLDKPAPAK